MLIWDSISRSGQPKIQSFARGKFDTSVADAGPCSGGVTDCNSAKEPLPLHLISYVSLAVLGGVVRNTSLTGSKDRRNLYTILRRLCRNELSIDVRSKAIVGNASNPYMTNSTSNNSCPARKYRLGIIAF
jgi:hypothetical protein